MFDAAAVGLRELPRVRLQRLPRMADFSKWATACETAFWPAGTFARAYAANRSVAIEDIIDGDPVAAFVRDIMAERSSWTGSAAELWRAGAHRSSHNHVSERTGWPSNPRALAGRLRRMQTPLRTVGLEIGFRREGRAGTRIIRMNTISKNALQTNSGVRNNASRSGRLQSGQKPSARQADSAHANGQLPSHRISTSLHDTGTP
jgi:hypothetical protein